MLIDSIKPLLRERLDEILVVLAIFLWLLIIHTTLVHIHHLYVSSRSKQTTTILKATILVFELQRHNQSRIHEYKFEPRCCEHFGRPFDTGAVMQDVDYLTEQDEL
jgi:hypothetical protein